MISCTSHRAPGVSIYCSLHITFRNYFTHAHRTKCISRYTEINRDWMKNIDDNHIARNTLFNIQLVLSLHEILITPSTCMKCPFEKYGL